MKNSDFSITTIDDYIFQLRGNQQLVLEELRQVIRETAPDVEEMISYGIPAFKHQGMLVYFAVYKKHCTFFVGNATLIKEMGDALKGYKTVTSGVHFTSEKPLPAELVRDIVLKRMAENAAKMAAKKVKKA
jgi:uncharacterized protein YdhG (YjbR/CyaY superfamily)